MVVLTWRDDLALIPPLQLPQADTSQANYICAEKEPLAHRTFVSKHGRIKRPFSAFCELNFVPRKRRPSVRPPAERLPFRFAWRPSASGRAHTIGGLDRRRRSDHIGCISCTSAFRSQSGYIHHSGR